METAEYYSGSITPPDCSMKTDDLDATEAIKHMINKKTYCELLLSCSDPISFACIDNAKTKDLPGGDASLEWGNLEKYLLQIMLVNMRCESNLMVSILELNKILMNGSCDWRVSEGS